MNDSSNSWGSCSRRALSCLRRLISSGLTTSSDEVSSLGDIIEVEESLLYVASALEEGRSSCSKFWNNVCIIVRNNY